VRFKLNLLASMAIAMAHVGHSDAANTNQVVDVFDEATGVLTIPLVRVGVNYFKDVQVTVGAVVNVGVANGSSGTFDSYESATNQLTIPVVRVGANLYYNVVITPANVLAVGGAINSYSVPVDLAQVTYPESYRTVTTNLADINLDPCNLNLSTVSYPATWLGQHTLPAIKGAPLNQNIKRGVVLKDVGLNPSDNPAFVTMGAPGAPRGCKGDLQAELTKTTQRLHLLGADYVVITQWHWASGNPDGTWYFTKAEDTYGSITDSDLRLFVQKAHAAGIKVIMKNQIQGFVERSNPSAGVVQPARTTENYLKWFAAYQDYIVERSAFFQEIGLDVWEVGCAYCIYGDTGDGSSATFSLFASEYQKALDNMKVHFTGQTLMSTNPWLHKEPGLASRIDIFEIGFWGVSFPATSELTVDSYKAAIAILNPQYVADLYDGFGKAILFAYGIQSRQNLFTLPGYLEETACTAVFSDLSTTRDACIQRETAPDFSAQAIVHEATLESLSQLSIRSTLIVAANDYWETDSLMPFTAFPNLAFSIRNKPAEGIVKAWFAK